MLAVRSKYTVKAREIDPGFRRECGQSGYKVQWLEDHMGGAVAVWRLQFIAKL